MCLGRANALDGYIYIYIDFLFRRLIISSCFVWSDFLHVMTLFDQVPLLLRVWALQVERAGGQKLCLKGSRDQKWHQKGPPKGVWSPKVATIGSEGTILELILVPFCDFFPAWLSIHFTVSNFETLWTHLVLENYDKNQGFRESCWRRFWSRVEQWKSMFRVGESNVFKVPGGSKVTLF